MQLITSIIILAISALGIGLFGMPQYKQIQEYQAKKESYLSVRENAKTLTKRRQELMSRKSGIDEGKLALLEKMLPNSPKNVALILELDQLARKYGVSLKNIKIEDTQKKPDVSAVNTESAVSADTGAININFTLIGPYENFTDFVRAAEKNLRLIDFKSVEFSTTEDSDQYEYSVAIRAYWLK
jgi:Tfp pilus assembly protein PilO